MLYFGSLSVFSLAGSWFIKYCGIWNQPCFVIRRKTGLRWIKHTYNDAIYISIDHVSGPRILTITQSPTSRCLQRQLQRQRQKQPPLWPVWLAPPQPQRQSALVLKHIYIRKGKVVRFKLGINWNKCVCHYGDFWLRLRDFWLQIYCMSQCHTAYGKRSLALFY